MKSSLTYKLILIPVASVIFSLSYARAQEENHVIAELKKKFETFTRLFPREEIYLHTDREEYIAGEDLYFSGYVINRQDGKLSAFSAIVYVELLNYLNVAVVQKKVAVTDGKAPGGFTLSDTLSTGIYELRAYTNWMKNSLPENCYRKKIYIYNLIKEEGTEFPVVNSGKSKTTKNQKFQTTGVSMSVNRTNSTIISIDVNDQRTTVELQYIAIVQSHGNILFTGSYTSGGKNTEIQLPASSFKQGINQITLFSSDGIPVADKLIYMPSSNKVVSILNDISQFGIREEVKIGFHINPQHLPIYYSISVAPGTDRFPSIDKYMLAGTEFGLSFDQIKSGSNDDEIDITYADSILSTTSSNWIDWTEICQSDYPAYKYPMETRYHYLTGKVVRKDPNQSDFLNFVFLSSPGKEALFNYVPVSEEGIFVFPISMNQESSDLIITPDDFKVHEIIIESPFYESEPQKSVPEVIYQSIPPYIRKWSINYQVTNLFKPPESVKLNINKIINGETRFYGKPDYEIHMAEFISLPTMEEVFFELIPNVTVRKRQEGKKIVITDRIDNQPYLAFPCLMIDGVIINDPDLIIDLDPKLVEKIDVIREKHIVGDYVFQGIVNVITHKSDFSAVRTPDYITRINYQVTDAMLFLNSGTAYVSNPRIPDYRNVLYWNPVLSTYSSDTNISFKSSDNASEYTIILQGMTGEGKFVSDKKVIRVLF